MLLKWFVNSVAGRPLSVAGSPCAQPTRGSTPLLRQPLAETGLSEEEYLERAKVFDSLRKPPPGHMKKFIR